MPVATATMNGQKNVFPRPRSEARRHAIERADAHQEQQRQPEDPEEEVVVRPPDGGLPRTASDRIGQATPQRIVRQRATSSRLL